MPSEAQPGAGALRWLWAFQDWATRHVLDAAAAVPSDVLRTPDAIAGGQGDGSTWATLAHVVAAEEHWLNRWLGDPRAQLKSAADYASVADLQACLASAHERRRGLLGGLDDVLFGEDLHYYRGNGEEHFTPLWQTVLHVQNHTAHHRAEACVALAAAGSPATGVDMIDWIRAGCPGFEEPRTSGAP